MKRRFTPLSFALLAALTALAVTQAAAQVTLPGRLDESLTFAEADTGGRGLGPSTINSLAQSEDGDDRSIEDALAEEGDDGSNWLAWLVGLPLLAMIILAALLLTGRRRKRKDEGPDGNEGEEDR